MLNLREYRDKPRLLSDYLPWACSPAPGIILNKDGSFQKTFRYRGPDLESATDAELVAATARLDIVGGNHYKGVQVEERLADRRVPLQPRDRRR